MTLETVELGAAVAEAVHALVGGECVQVAPGGVGASSAAFYVATASGRDLVARARRSPARFEMERLVMGWAHDHGVPVPRVHSLTTVGDVSILITDRLAGRRLADHNMSDHRRLGAHCGEILAR